MNASNYLTTGAISIVLGAAGSFLAPWAHWGIEKRRERLNYRRKLVKSWYKMIDDCQNDEDTNFEEHQAYKTLRNHMNPEIREDLERPNHIYITSGGVGVTGDYYLNALLQEISRLEKKWKLV